jgi:hypothetical protein
LTKKYKKNKNFSFSRLDTPYLTTNTFVKLKKNKLVICANDAAHPQYQPKKNLLKVYQLRNNNRQKVVDFRFVCVQNILFPVLNILVNEQEDMLIVGFINQEIRFYHMAFKYIRLGQNDDMYTLQLEELPRSAVKNELFNTRSCALIKVDLYRLSASYPSNKKRLWVGRVPFTRDPVEYLFVYNTGTSSLEVYDIQDLDKIKCCLQLDLKKMAPVSKITFLEKDCIAMGCTANSGNYKYNGVALLNLKNMSYSCYNWKEFECIRQMVYDTDNEILFVCNRSTYFSALWFNRSYLTLEVLGHFTVDGVSKRSVSLNVIESLHNDSLNKLVVFNGSNYMYSYWIDSSGKLKYNLFH